jgi:hypothetical protein
MAGLLQQQQVSGSHSIESQAPPDHDESAINPANGLPMIGGMGGVDVEGNTFGTDDMFDNDIGCLNSFDDTFGDW